MALDHAPPFRRKKDYTTGFMFVRSGDLPVEDLGSRRFHRCLAVLPGEKKKIPSKFTPKIYPKN